MPVWTIAPVALRPDVTLECWAVFEVPASSSRAAAGSTACEADLASAATPSTSGADGRTSGMSGSSAT